MDAPFEKCCRIAAILALSVFVNCPKRIGPATNKIEVLYTASIYEDLYRDDPVLAGYADFDGIKIGHLNFQSPFMNVMLQRLGFFSVLDSLGMDFIVMNDPVFGMGFYPIKKNMGYGIINYRGLRFAIMSQDRDSLSIGDRTIMALVRERSDVLWIIDRKFMTLPAVKISFLIRGYELIDTNMTPAALAVDTARAARLRVLRNRVSEALNKTVAVGDKPLEKYLLSSLSQRHEADVILYPSTLFGAIGPKEVYRIYEIINSVAVETKLKKTAMTKAEIDRAVRDQGFRQWGVAKKKNVVLVPDGDGDMIYDLLFE